MRFTPPLRFKICFKHKIFRTRTNIPRKTKVPIYIYIHAHQLPRKARCSRVAPRRRGDEGSGGEGREGYPRARGQGRGGGGARVSIARIYQRVCVCIPYKDTKGRGRFNWGEDFFHYTERNCLVNFTRYHYNSLTDCPLTNFTMYTIVIFL